MTFFNVFSSGKSDPGKPMQNYQKIPKVQCPSGILFAFLCVSKQKESIQNTSRSDTLGS